MAEILTGFSPEMAVADAMMYAQATFVEQIRGKYGDKALKVDWLEYRLAKQTLGRCREGSALSIFYLLKNFPTKFDKLALIVGHGPFTYNTKHKWHTYFLAHDPDKGFWHAGSPANHTANSPTSHLTTLHSSPDLNGILKQIKKKDGGEWIAPGLIEKSLQNQYIAPSIFQTPSRSAHIDILTFDVEYRGDVLNYNTGKTSFHSKVFKLETYEVS